MQSQYGCAGSRPTEGRANSKAGQAQPLGGIHPKDMV